MAKNPEPKRNSLGFGVTIHGKDGMPPVEQRGPPKRSPKAKGKSSDRWPRADPNAKPSMLGTIVLPNPPPGRPPAANIRMVELSTDPGAPYGRNGGVVCDIPLDTTMSLPCACGATHFPGEDRSRSLR
jgi:hypothetical protein